MRHQSDRRGLREPYLDWMQRLPSSDPVSTGWHQIERMLAEVPPSYAAELLRRMRTVDANQLQSAWLELLTCVLMKRCMPDCDVVPTCNDTSPSTPDLIIASNGALHAVECTVVQDVECDADFTVVAQDFLTRIGEHLTAPGSYLFASVVREGPQLPSAREVASWLDEWICHVLADSPSDDERWTPAPALRSSNAAVLYNDDARGWTIAFEMTRLPDHLQGRKSFMGGMGSDHTYSSCIDDRIRDAIGRKTRKYLSKWESLAIAIAVNNGSDDPRDDEVADALLGSTFCRIRRDGSARTTRKPDGLWTKRNSRSAALSGVLVFHRAFPWSLSLLRVTLWQSPNRSATWFRQWPFDRIALAARNKMEKYAGSQTVQTVMADVLD